MGSLSSLLKNVVSLWTPSILNPFVSVIVIMVISRFLGVEGLGQYSLILSYWAMFSTIAGLGLGTLVVREAARKPAEANVFFLNATLFGGLSSAASFLGMMAFVAIMGYEPEIVVAALVCSLSLFPTTIINYMEAVFRVFEKAEYIAANYVVENAFRLTGCLAVLFLGYGIVGLFVAVFASRMIACAFMLACYFKVLGVPELKVQREIWRLLGREAATFASIAIFSAIHMNIDQIMLSKLRSVESVGIYGAADKLLEFCRQLTIAFAAALFPVMAKEYVSGIKALHDITMKSLRYLLLITIPIAIGTAILAENIITLIYGLKFGASVTVLRVHIFSLIPFGMVFFLASVLIVSDNQKVDLGINIVAALMNIVLNFLFIPLLAELGAVLAALITIVVFNQLQNWYIGQRLFPIPLLKLVTKPLLAAVGMGVVTYLLKDWNLFLNVAVSAGVYGGLAILFKALTSEEMELLTRVIRSPWIKETR